MTDGIELFWVFPEPPEPDANGEVPWPQNNGDGTMLIGMLHIASGKFRPLTLGEFWERARNA